VTHPLRLRPVTRDTPTDADQLVRDLLAQGSESRVDYKSAKPAPQDVRQRADFAKHVIGLSNRKDGGYLLIGVKDSTLVPVGLTEAQVASWDAAGVNSWLAPFAAPAPVVQVFRGSLEDGKVLIALRVPPFDEQPLVCTKTVNDTGNKPITREGALYIRTEETRTREVSTEAQMRELLGRAYVKRAERLLYEIKALIDVHWPGGGLQAVPGLVSLIEQDLGEMRRP
jgi:predicted HTH transcriptional regulator